MSITSTTRSSGHLQPRVIQTWSIVGRNYTAESALFVGTVIERTRQPPKDRERDTHRSREKGNPRPRLPQPPAALVHKASSVALFESISPVTLYIPTTSTTAFIMRVHLAFLLLLAQAVGVVSEEIPVPECTTNADCDPDEFCNFESQTSGECEQCDDVKYRCAEKGFWLLPQGLEACIEVCQSEGST